MEQHPVPQNITGFQFKLIGDMTVKQFLYLAGGVLMAYLILQLGWPSLIKWSLAAVVAGVGFAFAFVPIEERPLDRWLISFFKSVYSPTQFLWKKKATLPEILTAEVPVSPAPILETLKKEEAAVKIEEYLLTLPSAPVGKLDQEEESFLNRVTSFFASPSSIEPIIPLEKTPAVEALAGKPEPPAIPPSQKPPAFPPPREAPAGKEEEFTKRTEELTGKITALEQELVTQGITRERFMEIQTQLSALLSEKERLTKELIELKKMLAAKPKEVAVKPGVFAEVPEEPRVKIVTPPVAPKIGMPKPPTIANAPSGIVKNQKGAILPGILVEIRNQEGTPVRALKTGKLGQFAVATPLPNGTYTLHLEDPQKVFYFDIIEVTLTGEIVSPLEIFAKTEKDKIREELKKKLFSPNNF